MYALGVLFGEIVSRVQPYEGWILEQGHVGSDIATMEWLGQEYPHSGEAELSPRPNFSEPLYSLVCTEMCSVGH